MFSGRTTVQFSAVEVEDNAPTLHALPFFIDDLASRLSGVFMKYPPWERHAKLSQKSGKIQSLSHELA